ncbi:hypothetical protein J6590_072896 [Homalodisca vitripennis]|nr:hypothetical protein J6590_072896 [Homalodisca vitripennis]
MARETISYNNNTAKHGAHGERLHLAGFISLRVCHFNKRPGRAGRSGRRALHLVFAAMSIVAVTLNLSDRSDNVENHELAMNPKAQIRREP